MAKKSKKLGKIYILRNPYHADALIKIGKTTRVSEKRAKEISLGTGVPVDFEVVYEEDVFDCDLAEKIVHEKLNDNRINPRREFFQLPLNQAVKVVFETCLRVNERYKKEQLHRLVIVIDHARMPHSIVSDLADCLRNHLGDENSVYLVYEGSESRALVKLSDSW